MTIDFVRMVENDLHQQGRKVGRNYFFKCPFHGGGNEKTGSLKVWNSDGVHNPGFFCFAANCREHGGAVGYFLKRGYSLEDARRIVGEPARPYTPREQVPAYDPPLVPPNDTWQRRARDFVNYAKKQFEDIITYEKAHNESITDFMVTDPETGQKAVKRMSPLDYWLSRGLTIETAQAWGIGYNPRLIKISRDEFGLLPTPERPKIFIQAGFVFPCEVANTLWYVKIRMPKPLDPQNPKDRFRHIESGGQRTALMGADEVRKDCNLVVTEGEIDMLTLWQEAGDLVTPVTLGSAGNRLNIATFGYYLLYPKYSFSMYDVDDPGKGSKGAEQFDQYHFPRLTIPQVKPFDKDINDYHNRTGQLREWVVSELGKYPGALPAGVLAKEEIWTW